MLLIFYKYINIYLSIILNTLNKLLSTLYLRKLKVKLKNLKISFNINIFDFRLYMHYLWKFTMKLMFENLWYQIRFIIFIDLWQYKIDFD